MRTRFLSLLAGWAGGWCWWACTVWAADAAPPVASLLPYPRQVEWRQGEAVLSTYRIRADEKSTHAAALLRNALKAAGAVEVATQGVEIALTAAPIPDTADSPEAYRVEVGTGAIRITGASETGVIWGVQTLRQLWGTRAGVNQPKEPRAPTCRITDWPAFSWRGFMHDVGRNPQDVELLKKFLDVMSLYKMNVFHFHLTDNPGYRIECRSHPELNDPSFQSPGRRPGFFYSYAQIRDLMDYAAQRGITILPEIDVPGHSEYFHRTFGCDMQAPRGVKIIGEVLTEFMREVPGKYLHIGSDEVSMKNKTFMEDIAKLVRGQGRELIVWRPGHLPSGTPVTQLWSSGGKPNGPLPQLPALDSRDDYVNHMDPFDGPVRILHLQTCGKDEGDALALGGILCLWPDVNAGDQQNIYRQNPVFPTLLAAAERYWRGHTPTRRDLWGRLPSPKDERWGVFQDFENRMIVHRDAFFRSWPFQYVRQTSIPWKLLGVLDHGGHVEKVFPPETELKESYQIGGKIFRWIEAAGATIHVNHFWYPGWLPPAKSGTAYATTSVYSPVDQTVDFWIGFNGPSRSDRRMPSAISGKWSASGGRIWIGGREIPPPAWKQPGLGSNASEKPFVDEDYFYRPPVKVALQKGWNRILVKLPKDDKSWKWMFTCVPVRFVDGAAREVEDLKFSSELAPRGAPDAHT